MKKILVIIALLCLMVRGVYAAGRFYLHQSSSAPSATANEGALYVRESDEVAFDTFTKLLLHCDGTDGSTTFTDSATSKTVTANGNAQLDTAVYKFGTAAGLFDGNGDYLSLADSDDWCLGSGNFTIDFWVRFNSTGSSSILEQYVDNSHYWSLYVYDNALRFAQDTGSGADSWNAVGWSVTTNTWYHIAVVRYLNDFMFFLNGSRIGDYVDVTGKSIANISSTLRIGYQQRNNFYLNGTIDELRISKGKARWTYNFNVPNSPYAPSNRVNLYFKDSAGTEYKLN